MIKTLFAITLSFSKIGLISLGGGNSMLKLLEYETVGYRHWLNQEEFVRMVGTTFIFPGLTAVKLSALIGYRAAGIYGLLIAVICLNLPGLLLALFGYSWLAYHDSPIANKIMTAVQYGAISLLAAATFTIAQSVFSTNFSLTLAIACILFFIALAYWQLSPFWGFIAFIIIGFIILTMDL